MSLKEIDDIMHCISEDPDGYKKFYDEMRRLDKPTTPLERYFYFQDEKNIENYKQIKRKKHRRKYRTRNGKRKNKH